MEICYTFDMKRPTNAFPEAMLFDMDGVLLLITQSSDQSWSSVCQLFAFSLGLAPETLLDAFRQSRKIYKHKIKYDPEK
ncbi:hypothetical protein [Ktedonospora formicarum]|uniref:Uncharacterized protein n=1 Tax=Ktedonospora formicarum TaxID=2778364 RepID=A0A8J3MTV4_9CHLR|nr:hypothetical protein [Ktedonospora formicarum]GHO48582.1 hypothetical protein KSX_67450 [Ktedonospora formicarum]